MSTEKRNDIRCQDERDQAFAPYEYQNSFGTGVIVHEASDSVEEDSGTDLVTINSEIANACMINLT